MKITKEISLEEFEGWSGAENTLDKIISEGKAQELEFILEDLYPEGMDELSSMICFVLSLTGALKPLGLERNQKLSLNLKKPRKNLKA